MMATKSATTRRKTRRSRERRRPRGEVRGEAVVVVVVAVDEDDVLHEKMGARKRARRAATVTGCEMGTRGVGRTTNDN